MRGPAYPLRPPRGWENDRQETAPAARWMTSKEMAEHTYRPGSILLGTADGQPIGSDDDRHLLTVAGSRAGKSSTALLPNLLLWPGSALVIDPKGELATKTAAKRRAMGQDVFVLDPFGAAEGDAIPFRARFNPIEELSETNPADQADDAALLADALVVSDGRDSDHWNLSARNLIHALILFLLIVKRPSLIALRDLLSMPIGGDLPVDENGQPALAGDTLREIFAAMMLSHAFGGVVANTGGSFSGKPEREAGSIISTAVEQTAFLRSENLAACVSASDFRLAQLKERPTTIYLVLPASRMATHNRWLRVIIIQAMAALERVRNEIGHPVLFVLEEFPQLGHLRQIEAAAGLMAGYDVKLWTILQDLSQIKALYPNSWETFIGNAGVVQAFGNTDATTLEYLSKAMGSRIITERRQEKLTATAMGSGAKTERDTFRDSPLLAPFEIAQLCSRQSGHQIVLFAGTPPAYLSRLTHLEVEKI